ncbi:GlxA family transcriptional regulator [Amphibiibacter pelophylacis]|uniref:GlxA family transcriptional regulator n=1 Tax=Amphibiibacter pelophylacis TaxID=1799477 RepID=A0ACC6P513_9BURK
MTPSPIRPLRVGFILAPRFTLTAFSGFVDALRLAADEGDRSQRVHCDWEVLGPPQSPIVSSSGVAVLATAELDDPSRFDLIAVVGGLLDGHRQVSAQTWRDLQRAAQAGVTLAGLCTGSFLLARAGLLEGYLTCVSWFHREEFEAEFPNCRVTSNQMYVLDRDRMTCAGGTSVVHLAAHLIAQRMGRSASVKALRILLEDQPLPSRALQPEGVLTHKSRDPIVHRAMLLIEQHMQKPGPVSQCFGSMAVGMRQLERRFLADIGMSPARYRTLLRLQRAQWLLKNTRMGVAAAALECGFQEASSLSRALRQHQGNPEMS